MQNIANFDFFTLQFDMNGNLSDAGQFSALEQAASSATDVVFLAHGFRNDENDASDLYARFLTSLRGNINRPEFQQVQPRKILAVGVYWPSKSYQESFPADSGMVQDVDVRAAQMEAVREKIRDLKVDATPAQKQALDEATTLLPLLEHDVTAQDRFVSLLLSIVPSEHSDADAMEGLTMIRSQAGSELLQLLRVPVVMPVARAASGGDSSGGVSSVGAPHRSSGEGGVQGFGSLLGSLLGAAGKVANMTTWYQMKSRSGIVGETGVARAVRALKQDRQGLKLHLVGHSLGGRLMASCARALSQDPVSHPDSLTLLEAAFSHFGFSPNNGLGMTGFFRDVITKKVVAGPMVETFSALDTVVGYVYAVASRLANDNVRALGDANDPFGGIGRNGAQKTPEARVEELHDVGNPYNFPKDVLSCLDGSNGLITSHGDITNDRVTYAFASVLAAT